MSIINERALYSDESGDYRIPNEVKTGDTVTVVLRTGKENVEQALWISGESRLTMEKYNTRGMFDYYRISIPVGEENIPYYFEILAGGERVFYNEIGVSRDLKEEYCFVIAPNFSTPEWAKGAVMYQIYVDRFCNGDESNDVLTGEYCYIGAQVEKIEDWYAVPKAMDVRCFYGGDLQGIIDKLDYLQDLGIEAIYMNPLFVSPSNHKYDGQDYDYIDPHFTVIKNDGGDLLSPIETQNRKATKYIQRTANKENLEASNEFFIHFIEEVHKRGMKVILDGVFNHCGSFHKWLDRERIYEGQEGYEEGAYISADSPYREYFKFNNQHDWPYNEFYDGWWGHDTLPKLHYEHSQELYDYIMRIGRKWVSPPFHADGWRLDVAADLGLTSEFNHKFWKDFRKNVKEANPEAVIFAEHYGDATPWLQGDEWDSVMNYDAFMEPITWFFTGMEKHSDGAKDELLGNADAFWGAMKHHTPAFYGPSLYMAMNQLSNHDHSRFLTRTNRKVGRAANLGEHAAMEGIRKEVFREAVVMQMTWPGAPTLYYGDEAGLCGFTDPDNRRTYPWGKEDQELINFHKEMIRIHRENPMLRKGGIKDLYGAYQVLAYGRFDLENQIIVAINNGGVKVEIELAAWEVEVPQEAVMERLIVTDCTGYTTEPRYYAVQNGMLKIEIEPFTAMVLKRKI